MIFRFAPFETHYFNCQTTQKPLNCYQSREKPSNKIEVRIHIEWELKKEEGQESRRRQDGKMIHSSSI